MNPLSDEDREKVGGGEGKDVGCAPHWRRLKTDAKLRPMTLEAAKELMDEVYKEYEVAFSYLSECCESRAQVMCDKLKKNPGVGDSEKIWCQASRPDHPMYPKSEKLEKNKHFYKQRDTFWHLHVAPIVLVKDEEGRVQEMVLDPALADQPVTRAKWLEMCGAPDSSYVFVTEPEVFLAHDRFPKLDDRNVSPETAQARLALHKNVVKEYLKQMEKMQQEGML